MRTHLLRISCCFLAILFVVPVIACAQYNYSGTPLAQIIDDIRDESGFRFLYREALIADVTLSFAADNEQIFARLRENLHLHDLALNIDSTRSQAIIYKQESSFPAPKPGKVTLSGNVVDASTGERLPYATVIWRQGGDIYSGVSTNQSGSFTIERRFQGSEIELQSSYVGYTTQTIRIDPGESRSFEDLTFRLEPERIDGNELVVTGTNYYDQINESTAGLIDIGTFSPLGESNSLRALQILPSVSVTPALSDGMNIRGSSGDGFQVLVDGITVFNQSHLFGLFDSFNADVLQRNGFFYDIAPAQYQAPPGGTLSMVTKTGSLNDFSATAGASNTAYSLTLEGPLQQGKSSWLISGRSSYMNTVDWLNNSDLIKWGLDVDRPRGILDEEFINYESQLVKPGETDASFFDIHGKFYREGKDGSRFIASGYYGGDITEQQATSLYRTFRSSSENIETRNVSTRNNWGNGTASLQYHTELSRRLYSHSSLGFSIYNTEFSKDDFTYTSLNQNNGSFQIFTYPFVNRSILNELKAEQQFDISFDEWLITTGVSYQFYLGEYYEDSFNRPGFLTSRQSHKTDLYGQLEFTGFDFANLSAGSRLHTYSNGHYLRWSPRLKVKLFPSSPVSLGGGYSRNFQFLNKISLSNTVTSDVWILANRQQPPTEVDYYSFGLYLEPADWIYAQAEGYVKDFQNVRLHEINAYSLSNSFIKSPWFTDNNGRGRGIEFLLKNSLDRIKLTQTFSISRVELWNPAINNGEPFHPDWDRKYRYGATLETEPADDLFMYFSWIYATGTPNRLATFGAADDNRLGHYRRTDVTVEYRKAFNFGRLDAAISVFNLFDRRNPWYRELKFVMDQNNGQNRFRTVPIDVYDIGLQPSFELKITF